MAKKFTDVEIGDTVYAVKLADYSPVYTPEKKMGVICFDVINYTVTNKYTPRPQTICLIVDPASTLTHPGIDLQANPYLVKRNVEISYFSGFSNNCCSIHAAGMLFFADVEALRQYLTVIQQDLIQTVGNIQDALTDDEKFATKKNG